MDDPDSPDDPLDDLKSNGRDVDEVMRLLAWTRKHGFRLNTLTIGEVSIAGLADLAPRFGTGAASSASKKPAGDIFEEYGLERES